MAVGTSNFKGLCAQARSSKRGGSARQIGTPAGFLDSKPRNPRNSAPSSYKGLFLTGPPGPPGFLDLPPPCSIFTFSTPGRPHTSCVFRPRCYRDGGRLRLTRREAFDTLSSIVLSSCVSRTKGVGQQNVPTVG